MIPSKPGISSFDKFAIGAAIKSEIKNTVGNSLGLAASIMGLSNGDDNTPASLDPRIGARSVQKNATRKIGKTVSSTSGGLGPTSTPARTANLLGNPYMRRYEAPSADGTYNFGLKGAPMIGEYYDVYESEQHHVRFMEDTIGRDLLGYTHLENAAQERSEDASNDDLYLRSTYSIFEDPYFPASPEDAEKNLFGPKRYNPSQPYVLKPLEENLTRRTITGNVQGFKSRFEAVVKNREPYFGPLLDMWDFMGSHVYLNVLNGVMEHGLYVENYEFEQRNRVGIFDRDNIPQSDYDYFLDVDTLSPQQEVKGLLNKTNRMFYEGKIKSLVNRFATLNGNNEGRPDFLNTATDHTYGLSRGRNLRKLNLTNENGYPNPYCRVWTTHYQYSKYKNLIRGRWANPGEESAPNMLGEKDQLMRPNKGYDRLKNMSSLDPMNGRPIFTPYYVDNRDEMVEDSIKRCMFSIENLAWKDIIPDSTLIRKDGPENSITIESEDILGTTTSTTKFSWTAGTAHGFGMTLTPEQRGPNGGRIMWFPPYNLKFSEQAHAEWTPNEFIGRGEKIYSYVNSEREGTLSFTILVDHPSIINEWARGGKLGKTGNKADPLSKDEMILRYFAGCDALEFNPREEYDVPYSKWEEEKTSMTPWEKTEKVKTGTEKKDTGEKRKEEKEVPNDDPTITFYSIFYYPNDYSGEDFLKKGQAEAGLNEMFKKGKRQGGGVGYELGQGENNSGMTYDGTYYFRGPDKNKKAGRKGGKICEWYYPVDSRVNDEVLVNKKRYMDMKDFGLNANFYGDFWGDSEISPYQESGMREYLNKGNNQKESLDSNEKVGIAKSILKIGSIGNEYMVPAYNFFKNLKTVITKLNAETKNSYKYDITIEGYASSHGYGSNGELKPQYVLDVTEGASKVVVNETKVKSNEILAENRAALLESWIRSLGVFSFGTGKDDDTITHNSSGQIDSTSTETESDFRPKSARAAVVTLKLVPKEKKTIITEEQVYADVDVYEDRQISGMTTEEDFTSGEFYDTGASTDYKNQTYDDEYTYFKQINENDDMVKRYISDKVDYFDPAYHSITPEGFNARLTFLHQCLRQGPTLSVSDFGRGSSYGAGNLSFGRPPFCVLRIGDFYNTKICIRSINIEYDVDGMHWDLNPEGVGLQPMMANVTINFTFLGGSDISGPIARLQNAASYNYYANTSIYDRRSDYREGFVTKEEDKAMSWSPILLKKDDDKNVIEHTPFSTRPPKNMK